MPLICRNGIWYVRIKARGKQYAKSTGSTRPPGRRKQAAIEEELWRRTEGQRPEPRLPQVASASRRAVEKFLAWVEVNRAPRYHERIAASLRRAAGVIAEPNLADWTTEEVERYLSEGRTASGWAEGRRAWTARTANLERSQLHRFFAWAVARKHVEANPVRAIPLASEKHDRRRQRKTRPRKEFWEVEEIPELLAACDAYDAHWRVRHKWLGLAVRLALGTGARVGELRNLDWSDVDSRRNRIRLWDKSEHERLVPLAEIAKAALASVPKEKRRGRMFPGLDPTHSPLERALRAKTPCPRCDSRPEKRCPDCRGAGKVRRLPHAGWHSLRHTYVTHLLLQGVAPRVVMELSGHRDARTLLRYAHVAEKDIANAPGKLPYGPG